MKVIIYFPNWCGIWFTKKPTWPYNRIYKWILSLGFIQIRYLIKDNN